MKNSSGFSLIELLIVVAIIGIVAAIAIPNMLSSRRAANEAATVSALRTLYGANMSYRATVGNGSFAGTPSTVDTSSLTELGNAGLIDGVLRTGDKSGYVYLGEHEVTTPTEPATFYFTANPAVASGILATGTKRFGVATDGVIRFDATVASLAVPFDATSLPAATPLNN